MITNSLKNEKPPDGEKVISHHTKPPCLRAVDLGRKRVLSTFFSASSRTVPPLIFKLFQINSVSACGFQLSYNLDATKTVYNAHKFVKQFGQFVCLNRCHLRQFG